MGQNNIIELNGKKYDATSGALLGESKIKTTPAQPTAVARQGRVLDGFIRPSTGKQHHGSKTAAAKTAKPQTVPQPDQVRTVRTKPLKAHQPERPKTLMRHVVHKPQATIKPHIKTVVPSEMAAKPASSLMQPLEKKMSVAQVNPIRMARSRQITKSQHIRRYHEQKAQSQPQQTVPAIRPNAARPAQYANTSTRLNQPAQAVHARSVRTTLEVQSNTNPTDIFEAAIAHARSHEQKTPHGAYRHSARRRRVVNIMAGVGAFLLIAGFIGYLNLPAMELRIASMRAGFHAEMPSYKPTGYALAGDIESGDGKIAMSFRSGDSSYKITQEASDWNSTTLLDQNTPDRGTPSQTIQSKGRTIYIYSDTSATWVNGGVRYEITGNATLDADELVALATSM